MQENILHLMGFNVELTFYYDYKAKIEIFEDYFKYKN